MLLVGISKLLVGVTSRNEKLNSKNPLLQFEN